MKPNFVNFDSQRYGHVEINPERIQFFYQPGNNEGQTNIVFDKDDALLINENIAQVAVKLGIQLLKGD